LLRRRYVSGLASDYRKLRSILTVVASASMLTLQLAA
jgi:hypothetical protein